VVAPIALYFYAVHPAWSWMYWFDPRKLSGVAVVPLMVGHAALVIGGWYVAAMLLRAGHQGALYYASGAIALFMLILVVGARDRLGVAADYPGWQDKTGASLFEVKLGWAILVSVMALFGSAILISIELSRDGVRVRSR